MSEVLILSLPGSKYEPLDKDLKGNICVLSNGVVKISSHLKEHHAIAEWLFGLTKFQRYIRTETKYLAQPEIHAFIKNNMRNMENGEQSSAAQKAIDLLAEGQRRTASDIHIIVNERADTTVIKMRILGNLRVIGETRNALYGTELNRIYYSTMVDKVAVGNSSFTPSEIVSARIGHHKDFPEGMNGCRLQNHPLITGNKMTLRLLYDSVDGCDTLNALGFSQHHERTFNMFATTPQGLILVSGPTGSGKTTSLHRYLKGIIRRVGGNKSIETLEDPVELEIQGANQAEVGNSNNPVERAKEYTQFLSSLLRSDPDYVLLGEIRDDVTADTAVQAAMTGHQVASTVHANNALGSLSRLKGLGVNPDILFDHNNVIGLVSQRLVRTLCSCKVPLKEAIDDYTPKQLERLAELSFSVESVYVKGKGCVLCDGQGFSGREVVAQVIRTDQTLMSLMRDGNLVKAAEHVTNVMKVPTIIEHASEKIRAGIVDPFDAETIIGSLKMDEINADSKITQTEIMQNSEVFDEAKT